jgi:hypothetical protein
MAGPFAILARTGINKEIRGERREGIREEIKPTAMHLYSTYQLPHTPCHRDDLARTLLKTQNKVVA